MNSQRSIGKNANIVNLAKYDKKNHSQFERSFRISYLIRQMLTLLQLLLLLLQQVLPQQALPL